MRKIFVLLSISFVVLLTISCFGGDRGESREIQTPKPSVDQDSTPISEDIFLKEGLKVGDLAPDFTVYDINNHTVKLSDWRGQYVFLNFWAFWCPPCRYEMPSMEQIWQERKDENFIMLAVAVNDRQTKAQALKFFEEHNLSYTFLWDANNEAAQKFDLKALPTTVLISPDGVIAAVRIGGADWTSKGCRQLLDAFFADKDIGFELTLRCS